MAAKPAGPAAPPADAPVLARQTSAPAEGSTFFYLMIAVHNLHASVAEKVESSVREKMRPPSWAPGLLPRLAGKVAGKLVKDEKVIGGIAGGLGKELPEKLKEEVGLELTMRTVFIGGPLVVIEVTATALELERLIDKVGENNATAGRVSGWLLVLASWLGLDEALESKMKAVTMKGVMKKLEVMIPEKLQDKAGFDAEVCACLPADFPPAFFALVETLGVNGVK